MKNSYLTVTDGNDKTEELESNAKYMRVRGYSINLRNTHVCYMKFDFVRTFHKVKDFGTEYVAYWYQYLRAGEILLKNSTVLHSEKFTKCEISPLFLINLLHVGTQSRSTLELLQI